MPGPYLLGIDAGTSRIRAAVLDLAGRELGFASRASTTESPEPGWAQQDMDAVWRGTAAAVKEALAVSGVPPGEVAAVGPSGQGDGAWLLDADGRPLGRAALWNDGRAGEVVERWRADGRLSRLFSRGGTLLWPGALAPVLAWMAEHEPARRARAATAFCCKDWIVHQLTGVLGTDESDGSIPFMCMATRRLDEGQAEILGMGDALRLEPEVRPSHAVVGGVTARAALETGLREGTPVVAGTIDVAANAIGVGAIEAGQTLTILGTTALNAAILGEAVLEPLDVGATVCHAVPGRWLRVLGAMAGTPNLDWYLAAMGETFAAEAAGRPGGVFACMEAAVSAAPVGAGGVIYHPFLRGERAPFMNPAARAGFFGIGAGTTRAELARAVYEGVGFAIRDCLDHTGTRVEEVMLAGGGARSALWCQILADATGRVMRIPRGTEFGTLGAALTAGVGVGLFQGYEDAVARCVRVERSYAPRPEAAGRYDGLYGLYRGLVRDLGGFWEKRERLLSGWVERDGAGRG